MALEIQRHGYTYIIIGWYDVQSSIKPNKLHNNYGVSMIISLNNVIDNGAA